MSEFVKSVLNYYAAFTESRFSSKSTLNYKWIDDSNLSLDISFFVDFFQAWISKLERNNLDPVDVHANQFKREISGSHFIQKLKDLLASTFNQESLDIFLNEEKEGKQLNTPEEKREVFLEGTRAYNLALRKAIEQIVYTLQKNEIASIQQQFKAARLPAPTFNVPKFSQDIYDALQRLALECVDEKKYFEMVDSFLKGRDYNIILYDLLILLKQFAVVETYGTPYLFFGSIQLEGSANKTNGNYPLFFIEVSFDPGIPDCIRLMIPRDLVMLNTPAINSFDFQNVLTIPRASSFAGSISHLRQMDSFLTGEYSLPPQSITTNENCFVPPPKDGLPYLKYRFGLQVIKNEDKRILDYSELMTKIEKGEGSSIIDFVDGYLKGNVTNTSDETNSSFREKYPKNSARYFYSDNPLPLNPSQKKILTALSNLRNRIVVIDGPPGTGKSHTIGAITYWANQNNRSIIITSHKKEALDVVERMLTDKFMKIHPQIKPSIIRLSKNSDLSTINTIDNSLSLPVIDGAARRAEEFNAEAVEHDREKVREGLEQTISSVIARARLLPQNSQNLLRFIQLEEELSLDTSEMVETGPAPKIDEFNLFEEFAASPILTDLKGVSLDSLAALYKRRVEIPRILDACNTINCEAFDSGAFSHIDTGSLRNIDGCKPLVEKLAKVFDKTLPLHQISVTELQAQGNELASIIDSFKELQTIQEKINELVGMKSFLSTLGVDKKYAKAEKKVQKDFPKLWGFVQKKGLKTDKLLSQLNLLIESTISLKGDTSYDIEFVYSLAQQQGDFGTIAVALTDLNNLKYDSILSSIAIIRKKDKQDISLEDLATGLKQLDSMTRYAGNLQIITDFQDAVGFTGLTYRDLYLQLDQLKNSLEGIRPQTIDALCSIRNVYSTVLTRLGIDFSNVATLDKLKGLTRNEQTLMEYVRLHAELSQGDHFTPEIWKKLDELNSYNQRLTEHTNDLRLKSLQNHPNDMQKIKRNIASGKRLTPEQAKLLCSTYSCIIADPEAIFKFFPMEEGLIDILVFDEASQVSIAHSLSLILRAKQVLVFGDKYQYGAVSAVNVSRKYGGGYFKKIIDEYTREYNKNISEEYRTKLIDEETKDVVDDDLVVSDMLRNGSLDADKEWLKTFSIRMSTLDFCQAIYNYHGSLTEHFRSFNEIIDYSNEFFYRKAQIPLIINRLRTKPIDDVLRFIKVETQGKSGKNVNLDEIEAIRQDIEHLAENAYKGTIGIITSFREQRTRTEQYLREKLPNFHRLREDNKLAIWFVGDVQGEERDIVYYSFVQDKKFDNADLRTIYPTPGGDADSINSLKMQRLNVGFSRAKDTMVFVHSMELGDYAGSRLGDALDYYKTILDEARANDCFIADDGVFDSPKEQELYTLIIQSDFYRKHKDRIRIIPQFNIGKYIQQEYKRYIPQYRVDFLLTLSDGGKEKTLILEYDGLEYHTKNPSIVKSLEDFKEEYLEYDITRQLELESYGYKFLRINKFTLLPKTTGQTRLNVLNDMLDQVFAA